MNITWVKIREMYTLLKVALEKNITFPLACYHSGLEKEYINKLQEALLVRVDKEILDSDVMRGTISDNIVCCNQGGELKPYLGKFNSQIRWLCFPKFCTSCGQIWMLRQDKWNEESYYFPLPLDEANFFKVSV